MRECDPVIATHVCKLVLQWMKSSFVLASDTTHIQSIGMYKILNSTSDLMRLRVFSLQIRLFVRRLLRVLLPVCNHQSDRQNHIGGQDE